MIVWIESAFVAVVIVGCGWVGWSLLDTALARRRAGRERLLMRRSVPDLVRMMVGEDALADRLSLERAVGHHRLLAELIAHLSAAVYGGDSLAMARLLCRSGSDRCLLRGVHRARGMRRAARLKLLADLPPLDEVVRGTTGYLDDASREVRFSALLIQLAADPHRVLQRIADFEEPLSRCEVAEILHLLRRGLLPIAYRPLLESESANLQRLGVVLVEQFMIEEAARMLLRLVDSSDRELAAWAFRAHYRLHCPLNRRAVIRYVRALDRIEQRALMRALAAEGYTVGQVRKVLNSRMAPRYGDLVASFKRSLVCG